MDAVAAGRADVGFLAVDPARAGELAFSSPYVLIDGAYAVPQDSALTSVAEVDREGVRVGVKLGSAYDLHLTRTLQHAEIVRGDDGVIVFAQQGLDVAAGIRQPLEAHVAARPGLRVLDGSFMQIPQAVALSRRHDPQVRGWVGAVVAELLASGWVAQSLARHGQDPGLMAT